MDIKLKPRLYVELCELFARHDPVGLTCMGAPGDEYSPEVVAIMARVKEIKNIRTLAKIMHEEFVRLFDSRLAGTPSVYHPIATEMWSILKASKVV